MNDEVAKIEEELFYIKNSVTGLYWNGRDFTSTIENAKKVGYDNLPDRRIPHYYDEDESVFS
jgi:hypothetical protein